MELTEAENEIQQAALEFARANKKSIAKRLTDPEIYIPEDKPVSVFMAGSPGAGKTEASIELLEKLSGLPIIRIDPDELRRVFPGYSGGNAWLFQAAVSVLVEKIHDQALRQSQSFLLDGTLSRYRKAYQNIERSLKKERVVQILYVYQNPLLAWEFVKQREAAEGRRILLEDFINQYFAARKVVNRLKREFGKRISVDLLMKNNDNTSRWFKAGVDQIDSQIPEKFTRKSLEQLLNPV